MRQHSNSAKAAIPTANANQKSSRLIPQILPQSILAVNRVPSS